MDERTEVRTSGARRLGWVGETVRGTVVRTASCARLLAHDKSQSRLTSVVHLLFSRQMERLRAENEELKQKVATLEAQASPKK